MKITRLELVGYRRFRLARIQRLNYTPTARQQLILGTNGSGKSSLLDELSPLPARHSDYRAGGSKCIELEHQGAHYQLTSSFKSGNKHSFIRDGVECNEGGTYQVQLRLVKDYLQYTEKLHDLLIGRVRFTDLRPIERREWITQLSETDWTFALGAYQNFKSKARDAQGALRHQQTRLTAETAALSQLSDVEAVRERAQQLKDELASLLIEIVPNTPKQAQIRAQLEHLFQDLSRRSEQLVRKAPAGLMDGRYPGLHVLDEQIQETRRALDVNRVVLERATAEHSELEALLTSLGGSRELETIVDLPQRIQALESDLARLKGTTHHHTVEQAADVWADTQLALSELQSIMTSLPDNSTGQYTRKAATETSQTASDLQQQIDRVSARANRVHERLSHLKGTHDSTCPKCRHVWKEGVNLQEVQALENELASLPTALEQLRFDLNAAKQRLEDIEQYSLTWRRFTTLHRSFPRLAPLFQTILERDYLVHRPSEQLHVLRQWEHDVQLWMRIQKSAEDLHHLQQLQRAQEQFGESGKLVLKMEALEHELSSLSPKIQQHNTTLASLQRERAELVNWIEEANAIDRGLQAFTGLLEQAIVSMKNALLETEVERRHLEMAEIQRKLSDRDTLQGIVQDLASEVDSLKLRYDALQLLTTAISPTEGIIADRLREAIFSIIEQMNTVIASVWSHELRILECGFEGADLDYRFPVRGESEDEITPDVSKCSKGQMEMINIAFKLTAMLYLGLLDYPLFLDEPGEGFDEQHRDQIMSLIRSMLDSGHYSQLFMVSHIATSHGAFRDAQALVLDASNITLPGEFNEHVLLE